MKRLGGIFGLALPLLFSACGGMNTGSPSAGDFGATQGGVQDLALARELIAQGVVPPASAFPVEGMFSEHDLGLAGEPCQRLLCLRGDVGIAPTLDEEAAAWMQIAMSSTIDPEDYQRPTQTLIMTVDVSGSMGWTYGDPEEGEYVSPGQLARLLLHRIGDELGDGDRVAIVTYGSDVSTRLEMTPAANQTAYHNAVDSLSENGSTNMEAGLRRAYDLASDAVADGETEEVRVLLYTDARPNVGASSASEFDRIVKEGAELGVGLTVLGLGLGLGQDVLAAMADVRGGNAFSMFDAEDIDGLMADDWPWFVSPIAYDLSVRIEPGDGLSVAEAYGFPGDNQMEIEAATVFLSKKKGALLARLVPEAGEISPFVLDAELLYSTPDGEGIRQDVVVDYAGESLDQRGHFYAQPAVAHTVALALLTDAMARAAEVYRAEPDQAVAIMTAARDRFAADIGAMEEVAELGQELELAEALLVLMREGATQESPYYQ